MDIDSPYSLLSKKQLQTLCDERYISRWGSVKVLVGRLAMYDEEIGSSDFGSKSDKELHAICRERGLSEIGSRNEILQRILNYETGSFEEQELPDGTMVSMKNDTSIKTKQGYNKAFHIVKWYLRKRRDGTLSYQEKLPMKPNYIDDFVQLFKADVICGRKYHIGEQQDFVNMLTAKMRGFRDANGLQNGGHKTVKRSVSQFVWEKEIVPFLFRVKYQFFNPPERINSTVFVFCDENDPNIIGDVLIDWEPGKRSITMPHARLNIPSTFTDTLQTRCKYL